MKMNNKAVEIIAGAKKKGLTYKDMASICGVSVGTISHWKSVGRAKAHVIAPLERQITQGDVVEGKPMLENATIEDLAKRALQLGFESTFVYIGKP